MIDKSQSIASLAQALVNAQAEFPYIPKTKEVIVATQRGSYVFKYAPLEDMIKRLRPVLTKHGLGFTQGANGHSIVTTVFHTSGEWLSHTMPLEDNPDPQRYGSQFTYRRRYSLKAALGIETDDDDADRSYTDDGKARRVTPNAGALDNVPKERHNYVADMAASIIDAWSGGDQGAAWNVWREVTDNMEKLAVWSFLDSKMRRELKRRDKEHADQTAKG